MGSFEIFLHECSWMHPQRNSIHAKYDKPWDDFNNTFSQNEYIFYFTKKKFVMLILKIIMKELVNAYTGVDLAIYFCQPSFDPMIRPTQSNTSILYPSTVNTNVPIKSQNNFRWVSIEDFISIDLWLWSWPNWNEFENQIRFRDGENFK